MSVCIQDVREARIQSGNEVHAVAVVAAMHADFTGKRLPEKSRVAFPCELLLPLGGRCIAPDLSGNGKADEKYPEI